LTYFSLLKNLLDKRSDLREIQSYSFRQRYQNGKISFHKQELEDSTSYFNPPFTRDRRKTNEMLKSTICFRLQLRPMSQMVIRIPCKAVLIDIFPSGILVSQSFGQTTNVISQ